MAKTKELLGPPIPARGLAYHGPHPFGALWQAAQTLNLIEKFYFLVYAPRQQFFFYALIQRIQLHLR